MQQESVVEAESVAVGVGTAAVWAQDGDGQCDPPRDWRAVDRALRTIARRRAGLDAEEARWLREAEALEIWRPLGMVSALDYMERALGYAPRTAHERLRVARALGGLPTLTAALASGELAFSAVRELTRVATVANEEEWLKEARGKNLREVEDLVADHRLGDRPDDPKDPKVRTHVVRLEVSADTFALLRQARQVLDDEHGTSLSEDQLAAQLCGAVLDGASAGAPTGRAKFQVAVTVCERCRQGWQHGGGAKIAIGAAGVERALCDAQHIGSIDGEVPERAHQDVSPSVARFVWHRDGGRCRVPGCRSGRGLEIHHLVHRADGGSHEASNLVLACSACHIAHHAGTLTITGTADRLEVARPARTRLVPTGAHVGAGDARSERDRSSAATTREAANAGAHVGAGDARDERERSSAATTRAVANAGAHVGAGDARDERERSSAATTRETANAGARGGAGDARDERERSSPATTRETANAGAHVGAAAKLDGGELCTEAKAALTQMGWKSALAQAAVHRAVSTLGASATLESVIVEALRRCPRPSAIVPCVDAGHSESSHTKTTPPPFDALRPERCRGDLP
jgi:hypothetical protein